MTHYFYCCFSISYTWSSVDPLSLYLLNSQRSAQRNLPLSPHHKLCIHLIRVEKDDIWKKKRRIITWPTLGKQNKQAGEFYCANFSQVHCLTTEIFKRSNVQVNAVVAVSKCQQWTVLNSKNISFILILRNLKENSS